MRKYFKITFVLIFIQFFVLELSFVEGGSMQHYFYGKDLILINHTSYLFDDPNYGDIVLLKKNGEQYIKRVFAKGGDELIFTNKSIYIKTPHFFKGQNKTGDYWINPYPKLYFSDTFYSFFNVLIDKLKYQGYVSKVLKPFLLKNIKENKFSLNNKEYNVFYYKVPKDTYFVIGNNINASSDSREFGSLKKEEIKGKVLLNIRKI